jgi:hypothetical protein
MNAAQPPSFEKWVDYCFTQGYDDFFDRSPDGPSAITARCMRLARQDFARMDPIRVTEYLIRLFEDPAFVVDRYTDDQIADAVGLIFGSGGSNSIYDAFDETVSTDLQVRFMRSIATLYTELFDRVCGRRASDLESSLNDRVDGAVAMIWDVCCLDGALRAPDTWPHLVDPSLDVLGVVLTRCRTKACLDSAPWGIHDICRFPDWLESEELAATRREKVVPH